MMNYSLVVLAEVFLLLANPFSMEKRQPGKGAFLHVRGETCLVTQGLL